MTRQLIICSALIASVTGPALAVTNMATNTAVGNRLSNPAAEHRISTAAAANRGSNPADLFRASNPAQWIRPHIPVDFVPHLTNTAGTFGIKRADEMNRAGVIGPPITIERPTNPVAGHLLLVCRSAAAGRNVGLGACERIVRDPPLFAHQAVEDQAGLNLRRKVILHRPVPGPVINTRFGSTTSVNGKTDNQQ
jgi:hypothetical protein